MRLRFLIPIVAAGLLLPSIARSQASEDAERKAANAATSSGATSARESALARHGVVRDPATGDDLVAGALFAKVRPDHGAKTPMQAAQRAATRAGLLPRQVSPMGALQTPLSTHLARSRSSLPPERLARLLAAEEELGRIVEIAFEAQIDPIEAARRLTAEGVLEYAEPIRIPRPLGNVPPNDPMAEQQGHLNHVRALQGWSLWQGDTTTVIGIVDAGIDHRHEDLFPNIAFNEGESGTDGLGRDRRTNGIDDDGNGVVDDWSGANLTAADDGSTPGETKGSNHGTLVSGLAAAATDNGVGVAGVGYGCRFFPIKAASLDGGLLTRAYDGILYSARRGFKVINCSWGNGGYSQALQDLISGVIEAYDCAIVAGGGNSPVYTTFYPAGYAGVLGVGAIDDNDSYVTSWGEQIGICAPGGMTTNDNNAYSVAGAATSFSTPLVSGALALVRSRWPGLTAAQAIAHLRLSADSIPPRLPGMDRLIGYGRLNVERALATDPFSRPALQVDSVWLVDQQGGGMARVTVGSRGGVRLRLRNILGDAASVRLRIAAYTDDSASVEIDSSWIDIGPLGSGQEIVLPTAIPFNVKWQLNGPMRLRFEFLADSIYSDYQYGRQLFYQPFITASNGALAVSLTDHGRLGFDDLDGNVGDGVTYKGASMLYEGGLIIASEPSRVLSNVRNAVPMMQQEDFLPIEYPSESNGYRLLLSDSLTGDRRISLLVGMRLIVVDSIAEAVALEVTTRNTGFTSIDTLRVASFQDWDLEGDSYDQGVRLGEFPVAGVGHHGIVHALRSRFVVASGVVAPATSPIFWGLRNDAAPFHIYDGFDPGEKWITVSNGLGSTEIEAKDSSDVGLVIGRGVAQLERDAEATTIFVYGFGESEIEAEDAMGRLARALSPTSSVDRRRVVATLLSPPVPNPAREQVAVVVAPVANGSLRLIDRLGRTVLDPGVRLTRTSPTMVTIDLDGVPSGSYLIEVVGDGARSTVPLVVLH